MTGTEEQYLYKDIICLVFGTGIYIEETKRARIDLKDYYRHSE